MPRAKERIELTDHIVVDPQICHGKPTIKGTRIMVANVLESFEYNRDIDEVMRVWDGRVSRQAILDCLRVAGQLINDYFRDEAAGS
jgi:uncharacterized protein (DUF433 family)